MSSPLPRHLKQEKSPQQVSFGKRKLFWKRLSVHLGKSSFHLKRIGRLPLLAREDRASPSLQKEEESFLQVHEKESSVHSRHEKTLFLSGSGKEILTISSTFSKDERDRTLKKGWSSLPPCKTETWSSLNLQKTSKSFTSSLNNKKRVPSSYSW